MKTAEELRKIFKKETGINDTNSQGEPDIEYVWWLENRIIERLQQIELPSDDEIEKQANLKFDNWSNKAFWSGGAKWAVDWIKDRIK